MKAILEYSLPDDLRDYKVASQADEMLQFLCYIQEYLRRIRKYGHSFKSADEAIDAISDEFRLCLTQTFPSVDLDL